METVTISKKEYDRLCKFERDIESARMTTIDKYMVELGRNKILKRKVFDFETEIKSHEFRSMQNEQHLKCLQDELNLLKNTSIVRFVYWRWLNRIKQL